MVIRSAGIGSWMFDQMQSSLKGRGTANGGGGVVQHRARHPKIMRFPTHPSTTLRAVPLPFREEFWHGNL
jgi:hypothetical protein